MRILNLIIDFFFLIPNCIRKGGSGSGRLNEGSITLTGGQISLSSRVDFPFPI